MQPSTPSQQCLHPQSSAQILPILHVSVPSQSLHHLYSMDPGALVLAGVKEQYMVVVEADKKSAAVVLAVGEDRYVVVVEAGKKSAAAVLEVVHKLEVEGGTAAVVLEVAHKLEVEGGTVAEEDAWAPVGRSLVEVQKVHQEVWEEEKTQTRQEI